jgi:prolyl-tRNA editing enzyme YbaK/EbsC (Cys-tRNA(Pro) deacylase)
MSNQNNSNEQVLSVLNRFKINYEIVSIDPEYADTAEFCEKYNYELENSGNTIIVASKRGDKKYAACLVQANTRLDVNKVVTKLMGVKRVSFASADDTKEMTGMLIGGVTPFGLPDDMQIYIDELIKGLDFIILGSGDRSSKIKMAGSELSKIPNVTYISGLSIPKQS